MDGGAEEHPGLLGRQREPIGDHGVDDHRHSGECRNADHGEQRGPFLLRMAGQGRRQRQGCRSTAYGCSATGEHAKHPLEAHGLGRHHRNEDGHHHQAHHQHDRFPAQRGDLLQGDAHAQQRHADAQHRACGELDTGLARAIAGQKVQRHAEQQREQHHRRAVVLGEETRRGSDNQADDKTGGQISQPAVHTGQGNGAHTAVSSQAITMNTWPSTTSTG
ncbi:hypothetical protein D3C80_1118210 [compost metagenome]